MVSSASQATEAYWDNLLHSSNKQSDTPVTGIRNKMKNIEKEEICLDCKLDSWLHNGYMP